jgi:hypothetical protein
MERELLLAGFSPFATCSAFLALHASLALLGFSLHLEEKS